MWVRDNPLTSLFYNTGYYTRGFAINSSKLKHSNVPIRYAGFNGLPAVPSFCLSSSQPLFFFRIPTSFILFFLLQDPLHHRDPILPELQSLADESNEEPGPFQDAQHLPLWSPNFWQMKKMCSILSHLDTTDKSETGLIFWGANRF